MRRLGVLVVVGVMGCGTDGGDPHDLPLIDGGVVDGATDGPAVTPDGAAGVPDGAASAPDGAAGPPDSCATLVVRADLTPCATDAECTAGLVCSYYATHEGSPLVCMPLCDMFDNCPLGPVSYLCRDDGPSGLNACAYFNGPSDGADCCNGEDYNGNGYVDEEACVPGGAIGCSGDETWCGVDGECRAGACL
jgi:hypothetical protein